MVKTILLGKLGALYAVALLSAGGPLSSAGSRLPSRTPPPPSTADDGAQAPEASGLSDSMCSTERGSLLVRPQGSYGLLTSGAVVVSSEGNVVARGTVNQAISVPVGCALSFRVTLDGLVDRPTIRRSGVTLRAQDERRTVPIRLRTGLVRLQASNDGRRISGVARFHRPGGERQMGSMGVTGNTREITVGAWEVRLHHRGETFADTFTINSGRTRMVRLEG